MQIFIGQDAQGNDVTLGVSQMFSGVPFFLPAIMGTVWHVCPNTGDDDNTGLTPTTAFKTLAKALAAATAGKNDIVILHGESNTSASTTDYQSATLDWNKDMVHLIGSNCGPAVSHRSRVAFASDYDTASNLFTLSANGCLIMNISFFAGVAGTNPTGCFKVTGQRNVIRNCHIAGIGHDNNDIADAYSLRLSGAAENVFLNCAIGLDTVAAGTAANHEIVVDTAATRNKFEDCLIYRLIEHATYHPLVQLTAATALDRWLWFKRCLFLSMSTNYAVAQSGVFKMTAAITQGEVILEDCNATAGDHAATVKWDVGDNDKITSFGKVVPPADTMGLPRMV